MFKRFFTDSVLVKNEKLLWEIETLLRYEDSRLNQALIVSKFLQLQPQNEISDCTLGIIIMIEEMNQALGLKIRTKLRKINNEECPLKKLNHWEFSIFLILLLQTTIIVRQHQSINTCGGLNVYFNQSK